MARITTCDEAEQMLRHYVSALSIYSKAALSAVGLNDSPKYNEALELKERAFKMLARAREDYWNHVSKHECRHSEMAAQRAEHWALRGAESRG